MSHTGLYCLNLNMLTDSYYLQGTLNKIQTYYCIEHPVKESFLNNWSAYLIKFESSCSLHYYIQTYFNTNLHYWWLNWQMAVKCTSNISSLSGTFVITDSIWWQTPWVTQTSVSQSQCSIHQLFSLANPGQRLQKL